MLALTACTTGGSVARAPATAATGAACTAAVRALPATVLEQTRSAAPGPGRAAWGTPPILLTCGLPEQPPTTRPCLTVNGVDWVVDDGGDPLVFTAFGRSPALEVRVPLRYGRESAPAALVDLAPVASVLPRTSRACTG